MNNYRSYDKTTFECIVLARISDQNQEESGLSIPAQMSRITGYTDSLGFNKPIIHTFTEPSTIEHRKKLEVILKYIIESKKNIVFVVDTIDRFQRSFKESVAVEQYRKSGKLELHFLREHLVINKDSK